MFVHVSLGIVTYNTGLRREFQTSLSYTVRACLITKQNEMTKTKVCTCAVQMQCFLNISDPRLFDSVSVESTATGEGVRGSIFIQTGMASCTEVQNDVRSPDGGLSAAILGWFLEAE